MDRIQLEHRAVCIRIAMVLQKGLGADVFYDLYLRIGRMFMKDQKHEADRGLSADGAFWKPIWRLIMLFGRYAFETFLAVGIFGVLLVASWITRWFNTKVGSGIPEFIIVFKYLELFLLAMGVVLFVLFILRNTVRLAKILLGDMRETFPKRRNSEEGGNSK